MTLNTIARIKIPIIPIRQPGIGYDRPAMESLETLADNQKRFNFFLYQCRQRKL